MDKDRKVDKRSETEVIDSTKQRIVVMGTRASDAVYEIANALEGFLEDKGLAGKCEVDALRDVDFIKHAFWGLDMAGDGEPSLPGAIMVGEYMRQYHNGMNMSVPVEGALLSHIRNLCDKNGVFLARYRIVEEGFEYYSDTENESPLAPLEISKKLLQG